MAPRRPAKATAKRPARKAPGAPETGDEPEQKAAKPAKRPARRRKVPTPPVEPGEQRRADLVELRRRVLAALDLAEPAQVPALSRELRTIDAELVELVPEEVSTVDDLAARRAARRAGSSGSGRSAVGK